MASYTPQQIEEFLREFFDVVGTRQYVGARYVPIFGRAGEDSMEWDGTAPYEPLTVVMHDGNSYTSKTFVPTGIPVTDTEYWAPTGDYDAQVEQYREEVARWGERIEQAEEGVEEVKAVLPFDSFSPTLSVKNYVDNLVTSLGGVYVPFPSDSSKYGTVGQVLSTLANGVTEWIDPVQPTDEQATAAIDAWLDAHPEATTTVQDGSITNVKLADGTIQDAKLATNGVKALAQALRDANALRARMGRARMLGESLQLSITDLPILYHGGFVNADGTITTTSQHNICLLPLDGVDMIDAVGGTYNATLIGWQVTDPSGTLHNVMIDDRRLRKIYADTIAECGFALVNHFDANVANPRDFMGTITLHFRQLGLVTATGPNMYLRSLLYTATPYCLNYNNGQMVHEGGNYGQYWIRPKDGVTYYRDSNPSHVCFLDRYGEFISGLLSPTYFTAPEGTVAVAIGVQEARWDNGTTWISEGQPLGQYQVGYFRPAGFPSRLPYSPGQIHFTVTVTDTPLADDSQGGSATVDNYHTNEVNAVLMLPRSYVPEGRQTPLVIIVHGSGYGVSALAWGTESGGIIVESDPFTALRNAFLNAGFAICDINGYDNSTALRVLGSPRGINAYRKLYDRVVRDYNVDPQANVYGFSMGGIGALNFALYNRDIVRSVALGSPLLALYAQAYSKTAAWKQYVVDAYAFDYPADFPFGNGAPTPDEQSIWNNNIDLVLGYDQYARVVTDQVHVELPPLRVWHGTDDTATEWSISKAFVEAARGDSRQGVTLRTVTGAGHEICYGANATINAEYVKWFRRFTDV